MSDPVELTIDTTDPLIIDQLWALGANGVFENADKSIVGFDDEAAAQAAIATLPEAVRWTLAPSPPLSTWDSYAKVVTDGRFTLRPPWLEAEPTDSSTNNLIELVIDPAATFGHGGHPTTVLALRGLTVSILAGDSVLDVGSGSGVLAIAAAKLGAGSVHATDISPEAVVATTSNAASNGVAVEVSSTRMHDIDGPFDVVVANMERPTLSSHLGELWRLTRRTLILSGYLSCDPLDLRALDGSKSSDELGEWGSVVIGRDMDNIQ